MLVSALRLYLARKIVSRLSVLRDVHRFAFKRHGKKIALQCKDGIYTYASLQDHVQRMIAAFQESGLRKGDVIFALLNDGVDQVALRLAAGDAGLILAAFNAAHSPQMLLDSHRTCKASLLIYHPSIAAAVAHIFQEKAPNIIQWCAGSSEYVTMLEGVNPTYSDAEIKPDGIAGLGYTSGTTGAPKAMLSSHGTPVTSLKMVIENVRGISGGKQIVMPCIPLVGAGSGLLLPSLLSGAEMVIPPSYEMKAVTQAIETYGVTRIFVTPSQLIELTIAAKDGEFNYSSLTSIIYGTAPTPSAKIREAIETFGPILSQGYGMAEVLPPVSMLHPKDHMEGRQPASREILSSVGRVVEGVDVRIVNENGREVAAGEIGEVLINSPCVFEGYLNNPAANAETFEGEYYRTRDYGFLCEAGYLHVLDRAADRIMRNGITIYPRLVEEEVHEFPPIKEALLVQDGGGRAVLCVSLRKATDDTAHLLHRLNAFLIANLPSEHVPDDVRIFEELPRSILGKVLRRDLREALTDSKATQLKA